MNYKNNKCTVLDENSLRKTFGGKSIPNWVYKLGAEASHCADVVVKNYTSMAKTCYSTGKELGSYIRNW